MQVICDQCQAKFKIPDDKIPAGKKASIRCPKCKGKITIGASPVEEKKVEESVEQYDATEKPFDFIEEEGKTALVCEQDNAIREQMTSVLELMEYYITVPVSSRDALKKMRYHNYDIILVNENFDTPDPKANGVLIYLERLNMTIRRNIFVMMLSTRFRTMDHMAALNKSVNLIINLQNIGDFGKILNRGLADHNLFYRVYRDVLKKLGRL
jgi:predicted Zn finger-like uncharacterized protein